MDLPAERRDPENTTARPYSSLDQRAGSFGRTIRAAKAPFYMEDVRGYKQPGPQGQVNFGGSSTGNAYFGPSCS